MDSTLCSNVWHKNVFIAELSALVWVYDAIYFYSSCEIFRIDQHDDLKTFSLPDWLPFAFNTYHA